MHDRSTDHYLDALLSIGLVQGLVSFVITHQHDGESSRDIILTSVDDSDRITQINLSSWLNRLGNLEA